MLVRGSIVAGDLPLPLDATTPVIMVGPGTGVAPFLAYLQYRAALTSGAAPSVLFFGACYQDKEFYHQDEL
jgi:sulfite reductase alpha subunit-like flavoprotein